MQFNILRKTMMEVYTKRFVILVSYTTPVACYDKVAGKWYRSSTRHSKTTLRHISEWATKFHGWQGHLWEYLPQKFFDEIFEEV